MTRGLRLLLDASASASSSAPASSSSSSDFPYAIVIGAAVGVLAVILTVVGLFFYCKERKRNKELALEPYVNLAPNPPASQLSPGIATAANQHSVHNSTKLQLSGSMDAHAGFYVMTSPVHASSLPPAVLKPTGSRGSSSIDQSASFLVSDPSLVSSGRLSVDFTPPASPALEAMVHLGKACVAFEPDARPTASQALYQMQLVMRAFAQEETEESYVF
ncbi:hypothetical protein PC119_g14852 [Phytophthora cactorum]|nr:hypothetical protein PC119_g14852 [Phytophthora cactorum]